MTHEREPTTTEPRPDRDPEVADAPQPGGPVVARPSPLQSGTDVRDSLTTASPTPNPGGDLAAGGPADSRTPPPSMER